MSVIGVIVGSLEFASVDLLEIRAEAFLYHVRFLSLASSSHLG